MRIAVAYRTIQHAIQRIRTVGTEVGFGGRQRMEIVSNREGLGVGGIDHRVELWSILDECWGGGDGLRLLHFWLIITLHSDYSVEDRILRKGSARVAK